MGKRDGGDCESKMCGGRGFDGDGVETVMEMAMGGDLVGFDVSLFDGGGAWFSYARFLRI